MKYFLFFTTASLFCSCIIMDKIAGFGNEIDGFDRCYKSEINEINKLCKINGYYKGKFSKFKDKYWGWSIIFYKDGTCAVNVESAVQQDIYRGEAFHSINNSIFWGTFVIQNDTIITHSIDYNTQRESNIYEYSFKVINDTTLKMISTKYLNSGRIKKNNSTSNDYVLPLKFIELENKPDSSFKLKEKSWFWCDNQKYNEYIGKLKFKKRN